MKICFKCQRELPLSDFYKHKQMADGHLNKCKKCSRGDSTKNRNENIDRIREYDRNRGNRQDPDYMKGWREKYPAKYKAHNMVNNSIRDGKITKPDYCQGCGDKCKAHGHHQDYGKPLDVVWLCPACHKFIHEL